MQAIFDPANSAAVGAWGLLLGIVGLLLTVAGFGISIWQIIKAKSAANAAKEAVAAVQVRVNRYDVAVDLSEAKTSLQNARHYASLDAWPQFVVSFEMVSEALGRVILLATETEPQVAVDLKRCRARIMKACYSIEKYIEGVGPPPVKSNLNKSIRAEMHIVQEAAQKNWKGALS